MAAVAPPTIHKRPSVIVVVVFDGVEGNFEDDNSVVAVDSNEFDDDDDAHSMASIGAPDSRLGYVLVLFPSLQVNLWPTFAQQCSGCYVEFIS